MKFLQKFLIFIFQYDKYANCLPRFIDADNMKAKL